MQVHVVMLALSYNLLEHIRLLTRRHDGTILGEDFAADITMTLRFPLETFPAFQADLQQLSSGSLQAEIIETSEMLVPA
jgi:putative IMPACT (imprinted ancient) family translation regulator